MAPLNREDAAALIRRRHPEWIEHQRRWRWLADSLEGGQRYRHADYYPDPILTDWSGYRPWYLGGYGIDWQTGERIPVAYGQVVDRNLIPHLSETSGDRRDLYVQRLHRTPVPCDLGRVVHLHLARVFAKEVRRTSDDARLTAWWGDVDGAGTTMDTWMQETVGPLLLALGQLDLCFDHPPAPEGVTIRSRADAQEYGLTACVASVILPENLVWWRLDPRSRRYTEALVHERRADDNAPACWRHWTETGSDAYTSRGDWIEDLSYEHKFGCVPIVRVFVARKVRCAHTGQSPYEEIAELQKNIYNRESEQVLSDIQQSHAQLSVPSEMCQGDKLLTGPGGVLPKFRNPDGSYEGCEYLDPPKGAQAELRQHILDDRDRIDLIAGLSKPAGTNTRGAVAQSGVSKVMDDQSLIVKLSRVAAVMAAAERAVLPVVLAVLRDRPPTDPALAAEVAATAPRIVYPRDFGLTAPSDMADASTELAGMAEAAGQAPVTETEIMQTWARLKLTGLDDAKLKQIDDEIAALVEGKAERRQQALEGVTLRPAPAPVGAGAGADAGEDDYGPGAGPGGMGGFGLGTDGEPA
jgi:hypothetical protein